MGGRGPTPAADLGCLSAGPSPYAFGFQETRRPALESPSGAPLACLRKSRQLGLQPPAPAPASQVILRALPPPHAHTQIYVRRRCMDLVEFYFWWIYA